MTTVTHIFPGAPELAYDLSGPADAPLLVCLHGCSADRTSWAPVAERFSDRWRVCAVDLRGHGRSGHTPGAYALDDYVADVERLLDRLGDPAVVVGHSLGALVAYALAQRGHRLVDAVFLEDPPLYGVDPVSFAATSFPRTFAALRDHVARLRAAGGGVDEVKALLATVPHPGGGTLGERLHHDALCSRAGALSTMDLDVVTELLEGRTFADFDPSAPLRRAVTVVAADPACDAAFLPEHARRLRSVAPDAEVITLAGGGHNLRGEIATREAYLDVLGVFLARRSRASERPAVPVLPEHVLTTGDRRIAYGARGPLGDAAIVFVHGWPDSWRSWEPVMAALPPSTPAVSVSLRGFGGSDAPVSGFAPSDLGDDVTAVIEHLGLRSVVLVGHSLGSVVVQHLAASLGAVVAGVVLVGGFGRLDASVAHEVVAALSTLREPVDESFVREFQRGTLALPVRSELFEQIVAESRRAPLRVWRETFHALLASEPPDPARVAAPVLLLWGDRDVLVPRAEQERLLADLADARLTVYEGGGHSPNWEQPARVAADVSAFVASLPGAGRTRAPARHPVS